jgi:hypothetical protein
MIVPAAARRRNVVGITTYMLEETGLYKTEKGKGHRIASHP